MRPKISWTIGEMKFANVRTVYSSVGEQEAVRLYSNTLLATLKHKSALRRALELGWSSNSSRYPSMPRYPPSPSHSEIDVSEIRKASFKVTGMECTACAGSIEKAIERLRKPQFPCCRTELKSCFDQEAGIQEAIEDAGQASMTIRRFRIEGMTCTSFSSSIKAAMNKAQGVQKAVVALATEECEVRHDLAMISYA